MKEFEFTLKFSIPEPETDIDTCLEALGNAGCTDPVVGIGQAGRIALAFTREGRSALDAVASAMLVKSGGVPRRQQNNSPTTLLSAQERQRIK